MAKATKKVKELSPEYLQALLECKELSVKSIDLLKKCETFTECDKTSLEKLIKEVKEACKSDITELTSSKQNPNVPVSVIVKAFISMLLKILSETDILSSYVIHSTAAYLSGILICTIDDAAVKDDVCRICEQVVALKTISEDILLIGVLCIEHLLDTVFREGKKSFNSEIKRIWNIHKVINEINMFNPTYKSFNEKLIQCVTNKHFLMCKEGRQLIAVFMARDSTLVVKVQTCIINTVPIMSKSLSAKFGDVYYLAWGYAVPNVQKVIEEKCIQDIMTRVLSIDRNGMEMVKAGQNGLSILSQLHTLRKNRLFSAKITELYNPLIWRHLRSGNPYERCNAAEIFIDVFPLERSDNIGVDSVTFKERQLKELNDLLTDDCHFVRIIGIKGICKHLLQSYEVFCLNDIHNFIKIIVERCANDGSTFLVRRAVYENFEKLLDQESSASLLTAILPLLSMYVHDEHEKVRKAFLQLLLKVKDCPHVVIKYWDVVPLDHLIARLQEEGPVVGELIVQLLMSNFYTKEKSMDTVLSRLIRFIKDYPGAGVKLFRYSKKVIDAEDAFKIIVVILTALKNKLSEVKESRAELENSEQKHKKKKLSPLNEISNAIDSGENKSTSDSSYASSCEENGEDSFLENHALIIELIDCISTLSMAFQDGFKEREDIQKALHMVGSTLIPILLKYYKGTPVFYTVIAYSSLIPLSVLNPCVPITSICISELKGITDETPKKEIDCLVYSLCIWNRGPEVLELVTEWIDHAFRIHNLNSTALPKPGKRPVKVRFVPTVGKPLLALKVLHVMLNNSIAERRLLDKSYNQVYEFFRHIERIKVLLEMRISLGDEFPENELSDKFLHTCFERYLGLVLTLHRPEQAPESASFISNDIELQPVDSCKVMNEILVWSEILLKNLPNDEVDIDSPPDLTVKCLQSLLHYANTLLSTMECHKITCLSIGVLAKELIEKGCFVWFLDEYFACIHNIAYHSIVYTPNDEWSTLRTVIPLMLENVLTSIAELGLETGHLSVVFPNIPQLRSNIFSTLKHYLYFFGGEDHTFKKVLGMFLDCCCSIIQKDINRIEAIEKHKSVEEYPCMVGIIMKTIILKPVLCKHILTCMKETMKDSPNLLAYASLLHTLNTSYKGKFSMLELRDAVNVLHAEVNKKYSKRVSSDSKNLSLEDSFLNISLSAGAYQTVEPLIKEMLESSISFK